MKRFTAIMPDGHYGAGQKIQGLAIPKTNKEFVLLFNAPNPGDWGFKNTEAQKHKLGIKSFYGYTHHWLYPSTLVKDIRFSDIRPIHDIRIAPIQTYSGEDLHEIPGGIYEIFWKTGESSFATVGILHDGVRWIAPINWISKDSPIGKMDKHASSIKRMDLLLSGDNE